jgi:hypothetical protein
MAAGERPRRLPAIGFLPGEVSPDPLPVPLIALIPPAPAPLGCRCRYCADNGQDHEVKVELAGLRWAVRSAEGVLACLVPPDAQELEAWMAEALADQPAATAG